MYVIRSDKGVMVAEIDNVLASKVFLSGDGYWDKKEFKGGEERTCFTLPTGGVLTVNQHKIYLWENYYLYKE